MKHAHRRKLQSADIICKIGFVRSRNRRGICRQLKALTAHPPHAEIGCEGEPADNHGKKQRKNNRRVPGVIRPELAQTHCACDHSGLWSAHVIVHTVYLFSVEQAFWQRGFKSLLSENHEF
jgi:hypothetical protein